jgi:hypothetical protein
MQEHEKRNPVECIITLQDAPFDFLEARISCLREDSEQLDLPDVG